MAKGVIKFIMEISYGLVIGILEITCPEIPYSIWPFIQIPFNLIF